jgi:hypothetical protein
MKYIRYSGLLTLVTLARCMAGGIYVAGGLVPFVHWTDLPVPSPWAGYFLDALVDSNILKVSKMMEVVFGAALVLNLWVPLSLAMLSPVLFFILWVDLYMDPFPAGVVAVSLLAACHMYVMIALRANYQPLFQIKAAL